MLLCCRLCFRIKSPWGNRFHTLPVERTIPFWLYYHFSPNALCFTPKTVNMMSLLQWSYTTWTSLPDDGEIVQVNLTTQRVLRSRQPPSRGQKMSERTPAWEGLKDCDSFEDEAPKQNTDELLAIRPTTKAKKEMAASLWQVQGTTFCQNWESLSVAQLLVGTVSQGLAT